MVAAPVRMSVPGQVYRDKRHSERQGNGVPRVGVLSAPVEEDNFRRRITPYECAHLSIADINVSTRRLWPPIPRQPGIFSAVDQKRKLVFFRVHSTDNLVGISKGPQCFGQSATLRYGQALVKPTGYTLLCTVGRSHLVGRKEL